MAHGAASYAVVYRQRTEAASPPSDWIIDLSEFAFGAATDYDCVITRGNGFVTVKSSTSVRIASNQVSTDAIQEARITIRRALPLWKNIS